MNRRIIHSSIQDGMLCVGFDALAYDIIKNAVDVGSAVGKCEKPEDKYRKAIDGLRLVTVYQLLYCRLS